MQTQQTSKNGHRAKGTPTVDAAVVRKMSSRMVAVRRLVGDASTNWREAVVKGGQPLAMSHAVSALRLARERLDAVIRDVEGMQGAGS